jgi:cold shock protein
MITGTVKWFDAHRGFGFIAPDNGGADAFVHISAVMRSGIGDLRDGQKVSFDLISNPKNGKMSAENLQAVAWC